MTRVAARFFGVAVLTAMVCSAALVYGARQILNAPLALPADEQAWLEVRTGATLTRVAAELENRGIFAHPRLFALYARWRRETTRIQAGEYLLRDGMSAIALLDDLVAGRVYQHQITVVEGSRASEFLEAMRRHPAIAMDIASLEEAMRALGMADVHPEGQFFPDTYLFPRGTGSLELLRMAHAAMERELNEAWEDRSRDLPFSRSYEALILASIVEKETRLASERPLIAGVFVRRLQNNMRLQTDPTVIYGLGDRFDGDLRRRDLLTDGPYNTYTRSGLPPTPISLPGRAALRAAVNPDQGDALYFVATGEADGSHYFSATLAEHNSAVERYLRKLRAKGSE